MATITNASLSLAHDQTKKIVNSAMRCTVNFTALELCQMKTCKDARHYKLKCQLWGEDSGLTGADGFLFAYTTVFFFPDASPTGSESRTFEVVLGEGVLGEDWSQDDVYGKLILTNLSTLVAVTKNANVVHHNF